MQKFVGISWTRPVPWAHFFGVDTDIEKAAQQSRTIAYQRERIARHVKEGKGQITAHIVLNDLYPDRASPETAETLLRHLVKAPKDVVFLYVNFSQANGWRKHPYLEQALEGYSSLALDPVEMIIDGQIFNPVDHFRSWQQRSEMHSQGKLAHANQILTYLSANPGESWSARANSLNEAGLTTHGGKSWTPDNLRKFVKVMGEVSSCPNTRQVI